MFINSLSLHGYWEIPLCFLGMRWMTLALGHMFTSVYLRMEKMYLWLEVNQLNMGCPRLGRSSWLGCYIIFLQFWYLQHQFPIGNQILSLLIICYICSSCISMRNLCSSSKVIQIQRIKQAYQIVLQNCMQTIFWCFAPFNFMEAMSIGSNFFLIRKPKMNFLSLLLLSNVAFSLILRLYDMSNKSS